MTLHLGLPDGIPLNSPAVRTRLPSRRLANHHELVWRGKLLSITVGFDDATPRRVREIFADGHKVGSDRDAEIDDFCTMASMLLQSGWAIEDLQHRLSREATDPDAPAASIFGFILKFAAKCEKEPLT